MTYLIDKPPSVLDLGRQRESLVTPVSFDCSAWLAEYPGGVLSALFRPPGAPGAWLCASTQDEGIIRIPVTDELSEDSVVSKMETTAADGKRYQTNYYNQAGAELARLQGLSFEIVDGDLIVRM